MRKIEINIERLNASLFQLARIGKDGNGGVTRLALSSADKYARDLMIKWMKEAGMKVIVDEIGNITGIRTGLEDHNPVMIGSHIDTVISGGIYDGSLGVLTGLEIIRTLNDQGIVTKYPIALSIFTNEEGVRYIPDMLGSLVWSNGLSVSEALQIQGNDGSILGEELTKIGYLGKNKCGEIIPEYYIELHIEQGPILDKEKVDVGVVINLQGISWTEIIIFGESNHAGTTPMDIRKDAGSTAAKIINYLTSICQEVGKTQLATCGKISFEPNVVNVIPKVARMTIDLRNPCDEGLAKAEAFLTRFIDKLRKDDQIGIETKKLVRFKPVTFDENLISNIEKIASKMQLSNRRMTSGAGHDAQMMARICPAAMIFVPSRRGLSHDPNEFTEPEYLEKGANLLLNVLLDLAQSTK